MKKAISLLLISIFPFLFLCCVKSEKETDELQIKKTVDEFYQNLNSRDFTAIKTISTPRMEKFIDFIAAIGEDLVVYNKHEIVLIDIKANNAEVILRAEDSFGNIMDFKWDLIKVEQRWLLDMFTGEKETDVLTEDDIGFTKRKIEEDND